jgi:PAS domain S-box-containing protein
MLGIDHNQVINYSSPTWIHPDDFNVYLNSMKESISIGESLSEYRCITQSKKIITMSARNILMRDSEGNPDMIVSITHDITPYKTKETLITDSKNFLETLIESLPTGVFVKDEASRKYLIWNKVCEEIYSLPKQTVIGYTDEYIFNNHIANQFREKDDLVVNQKHHEEYEEILLTPKGDRYNLIKVKIPFKSDNSQNLIIGIMRNVTKDREQERELRNARERALESDHLKSAFLANMSHEIRTPLNSILGFADLLDVPSTSDLDKKTYLSIIRNNGKRLLSLINDIIDISKIESKQLEIRWSMVNINNAIRNLYESFSLQKSKLKKDHIKLFYTIPLPDEKAFLNIDQIRFEQILSNLIGNAIKFTEEGFIEFGYVKDDDTLKFYVSDTGRGIPKDEIETIFDRFRSSSKADRTHNGSGLGLTISKELVDLLGGKIWAESFLGKGSTFYFSLPYDGNLTTFESKTITDSSQNMVDECCNWETRKILITEDNEDVRFYLESLLKPTKIKIVFAETGKQAVDYCTNNADLDLVLMDIDLPHMDGKQAFTEIHKLKPDLPIIAETAYAMVGDEEKFLKHGFHDYLAKPFSRQKLFTVINRFLSKKA